jgi:hypothetical protein
VDSAQVGPDGQGAPGQALAHRDPLTARDQAELSAGRDPDLELNAGAARRLGGRRLDDPGLQLLNGQQIRRAGDRGRLVVAGRPVGPEQAGRGDHAQRLMRALVVIGMDPPVNRVLRGGQRLERRHVIEQLPAQGLVPPLDLPGRGRRPGPGEPLGDAVLPADPLEQHLDRLRPGMPAGELLPVVRQDLERDPVAAHRGGERRADRPARRHRHHRGDHHEPRVIIDAGDHLALPAIG